MWWTLGFTAAHGAAAENPAAIVCVVVGLLTIVWCLLFVEDRPRRPQAQCAPPPPPPLKCRPPGDEWEWFAITKPFPDTLMEVWREEWGNETRFAFCRDISEEWDEICRLYWRVA